MRVVDGGGGGVMVGGGGWFRATPGKLWVKYHPNGHGWSAIREKQPAGGKALLEKTIFVEKFQKKFEKVLKVPTTW